MIGEFVGSLQTYEMIFNLSRKAKAITLNSNKEESLSFKGEGDERILNGEVARFARKFKKYMKLRK